MTLKLGKREAQPSDQDFRAAAILAAQVEVPTPPNRFGHGLSFKQWMMLGNGPDDTVEPGFDGCGDCVVAGAAHETMLTNKLAGRLVPFTGKVVVDQYAAFTGYVIGDESTDQGTYVKAYLSHRRKVGMYDQAAKTHRIGAYLSIDPSDWDLLIECVYCFTCVGIGFELPDSAMRQFDQGKPWDVVEGARIEGGHYVPVLGRADSNRMTCVTWGRRQTFTREFYEEYNDEAWAIVYLEEVARGENERGLDLSELNALLKQLA